MDKEKVPNNSNLESSSKKSLTNAQLPKLMSNFDGNIEQSYLPKMRTDYTPSDESVESVEMYDENENEKTIINSLKFSKDFTNNTSDEVEIR